MKRVTLATLAALLLLAGGLAAGAVVWRANTHTTTGTTGSGDVYTHAENAAACIAQASAFTDYPLVFAGPSVLGHPLVHCDHMVTKTRYDEKGRVSHPGGDAWHFVYGTCTIPAGRENCHPPIGITIDPCALTVDGRVIPKASRPVRSMTVRGAQADVWEHGISFEQSPQIISIDAPGGSSDEQVANAVAIANALIPANGLASSLSRGAPLTAAFAASPDTLCRNSFVPSAAVTAEPSPASTATPAAGATPPTATLQLDLDPTTPGVQSSLAISGAQDINIDIVLGDNVGNLSAFNFSLYYDDTRLTPGAAGSGGLNANPDFNDDVLGVTWNCEIVGSPSADMDPTTGPEGGAAVLGCLTTAAGSTVSSATVVATLRLHVAASGASTIRIGGGYFSHYDSTIIGTCDRYAAAGTMTCTGGSVVTP